MPRIDEVLVPPRRLGDLLRESRVAAGVELAEVASRSDRLTVVDLSDLEHGRRAVDDALLRELINIYALEGVELVPHRSQLVIDLDEGLISVDAAEVPVEDPPEPDAVLVRYLALVHRLRGIPVGTEIKIRELDVGVLATALELDDDEVEWRLEELMRDSRSLLAKERDLRRRLLLPLAGVVVASTAVGVLLLVDDADDVGPPDPERVLVQVREGSAGADRVVRAGPAPSPEASAPDAVPLDIGDAAVLESEPDPGGSGAEDDPAGPATVEPESETPPTEVETAIIDAAIIEAGGQQTTRD